MPQKDRNNQDCANSERLRHDANFCEVEPRTGITYGSASDDKVLNSKLE